MRIAPQLRDLDSLALARVILDRHAAIVNGTLVPVLSGGTSMYVGDVSTTSTGLTNQSTMTVTLTSTPSSANSLLLELLSNGSGSVNAVGGVTDSKGNTWTRGCASATTSTLTREQQFFTTFDVAALVSGDVITITWTIGTTNEKSFFLRELAGKIQVGTGETATEITNTAGTSVSVGATGTTAIATAIAWCTVGAGAVQTSAWTKDSNYTLPTLSLRSTSNRSILSQYRDLTTTGTQTATATLQASAVHSSGLVVYSVANTAKSGTDANGTTTEGTSLTDVTSDSDANGTTSEVIEGRTATLTDVNGSTTEASALSLSGSDSGIVAESASVTVQISSSEANSAITETASSGVPISGSDSGAATETASVTAQITSTDASSDTEVVSRALSATDSGTSSESAAPATGFVISDSGTLAESSTVAYKVQDAGVGAETSILQAGGVASAQPTLVQILSGGKTTTLIYDRLLQRANLPVGNFTIIVNGVSVTVSKAFAQHNRVTLVHWANAVTNGQTVTVSYAGSSIKDSTGAFNAASLSNSPAVTGPASVSNTATTTYNDDPPGSNPANPDTYVKRGSTAVGTPPLFILAMHTFGPASLTASNWFSMCDKYGVCGVVLNGAGGGYSPFDTYATWLFGRLPTYIAAVGADPNRVFMAGHSAGAAFSWFMGLNFLESSTGIKGIAPCDIAFSKTVPAKPYVRTTPIGLFQTWGGNDPAADPNTTFTNLHTFEETLAEATAQNGTSGSAELDDSPDALLTSKNYDGNVHGQIVTGGKHIWPGDPAATTAGDQSFTLSDMVMQWMLASITPLSPVVVPSTSIITGDTGQVSEVATAVALVPQDSGSFSEAATVKAVYSVADSASDAETQVLIAVAPNTYISTITGDSGKILSTPNAAYSSVVAGAASLADITVERSLAAGSFSITDGLVRFDTSALDDAAVIGSAQLRLFLDVATNTEGRNLIIEYFDFGAAIDAPDWTFFAPDGSFVATPAQFGFESGSPQPYSPLSGVEARNAANPIDTTRNFGTFSRIVDPAVAESLLAYGQTVLPGPRSATLYGPQELYAGTLTSGSPTVTSISTLHLQAGMHVSGTGIPAGTTILSVAATSITLSANATASGVQTLGFDRLWGTATLDRGEAKKAVSAVLGAARYRAETWFTAAHMFGSLPAGIFGTNPTGMFMHQLNYQGLGAGGNGPIQMQANLSDIRLSFNTGAAKPTIPAYEYNTNSGAGIPGSISLPLVLVPNPVAGQWYEFIIRVVHDTHPTVEAPGVPGIGLIQVWTKERGDPIWTKVVDIPAGTVATMQFDTGTDPTTPALPNEDKIGPYRAFVVSTPQLVHNYDTFDVIDGAVGSISFGSVAARFPTFANPPVVVPLSSLVPGYNTIDLSDFSGISKTGKTSFRLHIDGSQPLGVNSVTFESSAGVNKPQLIVVPAGAPTLVSDSDTGSGTSELSSETVRITVSDANGTTTEVVSNRLLQLDTAAGADTAVAVQSASSGDSGAGGGEIAALSLSTTDSGTDSESAQQSVPANSVDSNSVTVETFSGIASLTSSDSASDFEFATQPGVPAFDNDFSFGTESNLINASGQAADSGTGADVQSSRYTSSDIDTGTSSEQTPTLFIAPGQADTATSLETALSVAALVALDAGVSADVATNINIVAMESATDVETEVETYQPTSADDGISITQQVDIQAALLQIDSATESEAEILVLHPLEFIVFDEIDSSDDQLVTIGVSSYDFGTDVELASALSDTTKTHDTLHTGFTWITRAGHIVRPQRGDINRRKSE